jgi:WD40 repeat protein/uncharacterized caspase-like protein
MSPGFLTVWFVCFSWVAAWTWGDEPIPRPEDGPRDYRAKYAVIVGIDGYPDAGSDLARLRYAANDAREFRRLLVEEFGYDDARIFYLTDAKDEPKEIVDGPPTRAAIQDAFEKWLPAQGLGPDDSVLFFFAGHGLRDDATGTGYLAGVDSRKVDKAGTCIPVEWLRDRLGTGNNKVVPCRHRLVVLDCCFSGTLFSFDRPLAARPVPEIPAGPKGGDASAARPPGANRGDSPGTVRVTGEVDYYLAGEAFVGMTAGLGDQPVADGTEQGRHSLFTQALLQALRERANSPRERHVFTFTELVAVVRPRVAEEILRRNTLSDQIPMAGRLEAGEGDFVFQQTRDVEVPWERAERDAREASSRRLASLADEERPRRLDRALLLASEAAGAARTREARDSLFRALMARPGLKSMLHVEEGAVKSIAFSRSGKTLATAYTGGDGEGIALWDVGGQARLPRGKFELPDVNTRGVGLSLHIQGVALSPDDKVLAAGFRGQPLRGAGRESGVILWDVGQRTLLHDAPLAVPEGDVRNVAFSPDGKTLAAGYSGDEADGVVLWSIVERTPHRAGLLSAPAGVASIAFSPDGKTLAAGMEYGGVTLWDTRKLRPLVNKPLKVSEGEVTSVAFSPDGHALAAGYRDDLRGPKRHGGVVLWECANYARLAGGPLVVTEGPVQCVVFSPDGISVAAGYEVGDFRGGAVLWNLASRARLKDVPLEVTEGPVSSLAYSPDGRTLAVGYWDITPTPVHREAGIGGGVMVWDLARRPRLSTAPLSVLEGTVTGVAYSPDGRSVAAAYSGAGGGVALFEAATGARLAEGGLATTKRGVGNIAFSPDGRTLAAVYSAPNEYGMATWDVARPAQSPVTVLAVPEGSIASFAFSPDGKTLAAACNGRRGLPNGVILWDYAKRTRLSKMPLPVPEGNVIAVTFSPDGKTVAAGYSAGPKGGVILWDVARCARLPKGTLAAPGAEVLALAFSRDGRTLAAVYYMGHVFDLGIVTWDVARGAEISVDPLAPPEGSIVGRLAFTADGRTLAAGYLAPDQSSGIVLWDVERRSPVQVQPLPVYEATAEWIAFGPNGKTLAVSYDKRDEETGRVVLWDLDVESYLLHAARVANRNFTWSEWRIYFGDTPYRSTFPGLSSQAR